MFECVFKETRACDVCEGRTSCSNYSTWRKQQYSLHLRKFVHVNLSWAGFELGALGLLAGMLPVEPPLLYDLCIWPFKPTISKNESCKIRIFYDYSPLYVIGWKKLHYQTSISQSQAWKKLQKVTALYSVFQKVFFPAKKLG